MTGLIDPLGAGLIVSQARPGGNTTSISSRAQDMPVHGHPDGKENRVAVQPGQSQIKTV
jgi:hypothetical protein